MRQFKSASSSDSLHSDGGDGRLDVMEQRITRLELIADDVKSALSAIVSQLGRIDAKFDLVDAKLGRMDEKFDAKFELVDAKLGRMDEKFDAKFELLGAKLDAQDAKLDAQVARLDAKFDIVNTRFDLVDEKFAFTDFKLDAKPDKSWIFNAICVIFGLVLAAVGASAGFFAYIR